MANLSVTVLHRLAGRIRIKLNRPPRNIEYLLNRVIKHEGIKKLEFNPISKTLLAIYTPTLISSTEILLRVSIALSVEFNGSLVKLEVKKKKMTMGFIDYYSGGSIALAASAKILNTPIFSQNFLNYNAGFSTTASVIKHAIDEVRHEGIYDPEVVSVVYLINSLIRGNFLAASAITWLATFGRHILESSEETCYLKAIEVESDFDKSYMDVEVHQSPHIEPSIFPLKMIIQGIVKTAGLKVDDLSLIDNIKKVSKAHHDVLEGIGNKANPIYMRIEY